MLLETWTKLSNDSFKASLCLKLVIIISELIFISPFKKRSFTAFSKSSIPVFSFVEVLIILIVSFTFSFNSPIDIFDSRSDLLNNIIHFLFSINFIISKSFSSKGTEESTTYIIRSASFVYFFAFSTPIFSIISSALRMPAVSITCKLISWSLIFSSIISLVVPAISVTIAFSSPANIFNKEDLPAFGFPTITVFTPSFIIFPFSVVDNNLSILNIKSFIFKFNLSG